MSEVEAIRPRLAEIRTVYVEIRQMNERQEDLETVEQAQSEYKALLSKEDEELSLLKERENELREEKKRLELHLGPEVDPFDLPMAAGGRVNKWRPPVWSSQPVDSPGPTSQERRLAARRQLKKLANRWAGPWGLEVSVLGRINRIADDTDRPLGEALVLLDWSVFADRTQARESEEAHQKRLVEWGEALAEFRDHLAGEIDILETRFRHWLSIWERWRVRQQSPEHERQWDTFIAETRRSKQDEITRAQGEIAQLKNKTAELQQRLRDEEGSR